MTAPQLRLVSSPSPGNALTPAQRIIAAFDSMMKSARSLRISAQSLKESSKTLGTVATKIEDKIPLFAEAERRLLVERDRALEIANDAASLERRIQQSSRGNPEPLTGALWARPQTAQLALAG